MITIESTTTVETAASLTTATVVVAVEFSEIAPTNSGW